MNWTSFTNSTTTTTKLPLIILNITTTTKKKRKTKLNSNNNNSLKAKVKPQLYDSNTCRQKCMKKHLLSSSVWSKQTTKQTNERTKKKSQSLIIFFCWTKKKLNKLNKNFKTEASWKPSRGQPLLFYILFFRNRCCFCLISKLGLNVSQSQEFCLHTVYSVLCVCLYFFIRVK